MYFTIKHTHKQILFKSMKEHQKPSGFARPIFWKKGKYIEKSPMFAFTHSLGSSVVLTILGRPRRKSEKPMAPHSSTLAWKIPWTEEPGRLQSKGSLRVRHDWAISLSCTGEGNGNPLQCSCLENPRDGGAWWAAVYGVAESQTWLKQLSSSKQKVTGGMAIK